MRTHAKRTAKFTKLLKGITRFFLNVATLASLVTLIRYGWLLFKHSLSDPLKSSIILLLGFVAWILFIKFLLRRYRRICPSFKLTTIIVSIVILVFAFAGVQPITSYKDNLIERYVLWSEAKKVEAKRELGKVIIAMPPVTTEAIPKISETPTASESMDIHLAEQMAFTLINMYREENNIPPTMWDDTLYELSLMHTQEMAEKGELFHGSGDIIGENAWGGQGYYNYSYDELATEIASSWVTSPLHNAWLLYAPIKESCISIANTPDGQYASWTFWVNKLSGGPELVMKISREYERSGSDLNWISWLKSEGYLH